ncbi:MAG: aminotransferase class I/II-fold pyridoxal phosphate-dependent enzyme [Bacteroidota bacterium]
MVDQFVSNRLEGIGEYYFSHKLRAIEQLRQAGADIINLGIGSPDMAPPDVVKEVLSRSLEQPDFHRYQSYKGIPELRIAFADWYQKQYGVTLDPQSQILPLIGSKEGIMHISMAFINSGDHVLIPNPGYPTYTSVTKLSGGIPIYYDLKEENDFWPDIEKLNELDLSKVKLMWVNYPHMPTGAPASPRLFSELIRFCRSNDIILVNDNPYSFTLTDQPRSILNESSSSDLVLELNSLSKSHNMSGWRIGAVCGNEKLIEYVLTFKSNMDSGMFKPVMNAAITALNVQKDWYDSLNDHYAKRKEIVLEIIDLLGCTTREDQAGMFVWVKIPEGFDNGEAYADHLLETYEFFVPPGMIFGSQGHHYIRFSLCSSAQQLNKVLDRIKSKK